MNIVIIAEGFFPGEKYGGPPVSIHNFCTLLSNYKIYIITKDHDLNSKQRYKNIQSGWNYRDNYQVLYLNDHEYTLKEFDVIIKKINPDLIYLQSLFQRCILPCLYLSKKYNIKVLLAPRGELCAGAFKKKYKKIPYIVFLKIMGLFENTFFQATSDEEIEAIHRILKVPYHRIYLLNNIPSLPSQTYKRSEKQCGYGRIVYLSRIHPKKNLLTGIKCLQQIKGKAQFDIYGPIEDVDYWKECQKEITKLPSNVSVSYCGLVSHEKVHQIFSFYDVFLFPTFSENYGHVIAESLSVGTPVIVSDQTPWNDINETGAGWAIPLSNVLEYTKAINKIISLDNSELNYMRRQATAFFAKKSHLQDLKKEYINTIKMITREKE